MAEAKSDVETKASGKPRRLQLQKHLLGISGLANMLSGSIRYSAWDCGEGRLSTSKAELLSLDAS